MKKMNFNRRHALFASVLSTCALSVGLISTSAMAQNNAKVLSIGMPFSPLSMDLSLIHI